MLMFLLAACGARGDGGSELSDPQSSGVCDLHTLDTLVDFGSVEVSDGGATLTLSLQNRGDADCVLSRVELEEGASDFEITYLNLAPIYPMETREIDLHYTPGQNGEDDAVVRVESNDPGAPELRIPVVGRGLAPVLQLSVDEDFADLELGCAQELPVRVDNRGDLPLVLDSLELSTGPDFSWSDAAQATLAALPVTLAPGEGLDFGLRFEPQVSDGAKQVWVHAASDDPQDPLKSLELSASAASFAEHEQHTDIPAQLKTDVLFVFDWSGTQVQDFAAAYLSFQERLARANADYQVSVVVRDDGCHAGGGGPITQDMSDPTQVAAFATQSCLPEGDCITSGSDLKRVFRRATRATSVENTQSGGCNEGLFRDDAELHIIGISSDPDDSPGTVAAHIATLTGLREEPTDVVFHGIGATSESECEGYKTNLAYEQAVETTGGVYLAICEDGPVSQMAELGLAAVPTLNAIRLDAPPVPSTLEVWVDGTLWTSGWSLDTEESTVRFDEGHEPYGAAVMVRYASAPQVCE